MPNHLKTALSVFLCCGALWMFRGSLAQATIDVEKMREDILSETVLIVGVKEPCIARVSLPVWESMNALEIYRWVAACEDAKGDGE